jgi:GNAT superfamily N-acetyltransferase
LKALARMTPAITLTDAPDPAARSAIVRGLVDYNEKRIGHPEGYRPLVVLLADPNIHETIGGLWGATSLSWLHIDLLFVPEPLRGTGIGRRLMREAEAEAIRRGCIGSWLDTYSFQARGFYEKLGYSVFGTIADYPPGHSRFFVKKQFYVAENSVG